MKHALPLAALAALTLTAATARAQAVPTLRLASGWPVGRNQAPTQVHKETEYLDRDGRPLPAAEHADHRREISYQDSLAGMVREYYPSGKLMDFAEYASVPGRLRHGMHQTYYDNGQLYLQETYVAGKLEGERTMYYADGKVWRHDQYVDDKRTSGESFTPDGELKKGEYEEVMPNYEHNGGLAEIVRAIQKNVRYPRAARQAGIEGRVFVSFSVNESGYVVDIKIVKGIDLLNQATLDAVRGLHRFAAPGMQNGRPVSVFFTTPITYAISGAPSNGASRNSQSPYNSTVDTGQGSSPYHPGGANREMPTYQISR